MKIVFFARRFYPQIGGVETHVFELCKELIKKGHKITVIAEQFDLPDNPKKIDASRELKSINIVRIKSGQNEFLKKFRIWSEIFKQTKILLEADVIHCHDVFFWYIPFLLLYPFKKVYVTFHGYETKFPPSKRAIIIRKISEKLSGGNICVGDYIKKWYGTKPDYVIYGGVAEKSVHKKSDLINKSQLDIIFIGRLQVDLGIRAYLESLDLINKKNINFKFQVYGDGQLRDEMEKFGSVHGFVDNLDNLIKNADIVFSSSYLTMLQALSARKIVIAVYENELKKDYLNNSPFAKYIYICSNGKEVADVVQKIAIEPWKSDSLLENGYQWANSQSWESIAKIYIKLWKT